MLLFCVQGGFFPMEIKNMQRKTMVIQVGLGPMGVHSVSAIAAHPHLELVAAVDLDPSLSGRTVGSLLQFDLTGKALAPAVASMRIRGDLRQTLDGCLADVTVFCTVSSLDATLEPILDAVRAGFHVVSSCEELLFPTIARPDACRTLDEAARQSGVTILGTGVNPGFLMDFLPLTVSSLCPSLTKVEVYRRQNASTRRLPFQKKIGAGLTVEQFNQKAESGRFGHAGLAESGLLLASGLGWQLDRIETSLEPVITESTTPGPEGDIHPGGVTGIRQRFEGFEQDQVRVMLEFVAAVGLSAPEDRIRLFAVGSDRPVELLIPGAAHGDNSTAAILSHAAAAIRNLNPGLRTMADLAPLRGTGQTTPAAE